METILTNGVFGLQNAFFSRAKLSSALRAYTIGEGVANQPLVEAFLEMLQPLSFIDEYEKYAFLYSMSLWIADKRFILPTARLADALLRLHRKYTKSLTNKDLLVDRVTVKYTSASANTRAQLDFFKFRSGLREGFLYFRFKSLLNNYVHTLPKKESSWLFMSHYLFGRNSDGKQTNLKREDFTLLTKFGGLDLFSEGDLNGIFADKQYLHGTSVISFLKEFMYLAKDESETFCSSAYSFFVYSASKHHYSDYEKYVAKTYYRYLTTGIFVYFSKYKGVCPYSELQKKHHLYDLWYDKGYESYPIVDGSKDIQTPFEKTVKYLPLFYLENIKNVPKDLLTHLAEGNNIRTYGNFASFMSKKMAHILCNLPIGISWENHLAYAYFKSVGADEYVVDKLCSYTRSTYHDFRNSGGKLEFWENAALLLSAEIEEFKTLGAEALPILLAFLDHCQRDVPGFSLKGRTLASLRRLANAWMEEIRAKNRPADYKAWKGAGYQEWNVFEDGNWYAIFQLTDSMALQAEGSYMGHCVGGYSYSCVSGNCSIWSLRIKAGNEWRRLATMEVLSNGNIVQAKAKYNSAPSAQGLSMIKAWALQQGLHFVRA